MPTTTRSRTFLNLLLLLVLLGVSAAQLGSQSGIAKVSLTGIPQWGQDGTVTGFVSGVASNQYKLYLFEFIPDMGWFQLGNCGSIPIQSTGEFTIDASSDIMARYVTRFSAYLLPTGLSVPCVKSGASIPFLIQQNAVAFSTIPRIAQYPTINFGGLTWYVKTAPVPVYAGPQFFIRDNVFVDNLGQLHLRLARCGDSWCASEIFTTQTVGYGTYSFTANSQLNNIDPNVTFGFFPWDAQAGDQNNREWDIEFGRWGSPNATANAQYVVQPYQGPNNIYRFLMSPATISTHSVTWSPTTVQFRSSAGAGLISQWTYPGNPVTIPTPGDARLHLNLYVAKGDAPSTALNQELVISNFQYVPTGAQVGFTRPAESASFLATTYSAPVTNSGGNCPVQVESDSPWLTVQSATSGQVVYSVTDNVAGARTGNLIMQSNNCNVALNAQMLSVTQAGLVCSPTFGVPSSHVGFIESVRSVLVRGTAQACSWTVASSAPWLRIVSAAGGSGDGSVTFSTVTNTDPGLRTGWLFLNNGQQHFVHQDAAANFIGLSPLVAVPCGGQRSQFGVSWVSQANVELRLGSSSGQLVGQYGRTGSTILPPIGDGTLIYMNSLETHQPLASVRATVLPANCTAPSIAASGILNAASFKSVALAPGALATAGGANLSPTTVTALTTPYPTSLGGISVFLSGMACQLLYVSPTQVNFLVPADIPIGRHLLTIGSATADVVITNSSPGVFTLNADGSGVPLASLVAATESGGNFTLAPYLCTNACVPSPMSLPANTSSLYVVLYGTGIRNTKLISAKLGPLEGKVLYFGAQPQFAGLDQVNLQFSNLNGVSGHQPLVLQTDGVESNAVDLWFQ